jgi:NTE family protein
MVVHATTLLIHRRLLDDVSRYRDAAEMVVLSPPCPVRVQPMDFSQAGSLMERALDENRRLLDRYGAERRSHRHVTAAA